MNTESRIIQFITFLTSHPYSDLKRIESFYRSKDFKYSSRTIKRDISNCWLSYNIDVSYNHARRGYYVNRETSLNLDSVLEFAKRSEISKLLKHNLRDFNLLEPYVYLDTSGESLKGTENLNILFEAIRKHHLIEFQYEKFRNEGNLIEKKVLKPHFLKESNFRWYLIGLYPGSKDPRVFGVDRISQIHVTKEKFRRTPQLYEKKNFDKTIGIVVPDSSQKKIKIETTKLVGDYYRTFPLHFSQQQIEQNESKCIFELNIIPNIEFYQKLLMWADRIRVISPPEVKNHYLKLIKQAIDINK